MEVWKRIAAFPDYEVSCRGRVKSLKRAEEKILSPACAPSYYHVILVKSGVHYTRHIHRLVAEAFLPRSHKRFVNHKNGDKLDNRVENLEWCTAKENIAHAESTGLRNIKGEKNGRSKLKKEDIKVIKKLSSEGLTNIQIALDFGVSDVTIANIVKRKTWKHI